MKKRFFPEDGDRNRNPFGLQHVVISFFILVGFGGLGGCGVQPEPKPFVDYFKFPKVKASSPIPKNEVPYVLDELLVFYQQAVSPENADTRPSIQPFIALREKTGGKRNEKSMEDLRSLLSTQKEIIGKLGEELISDYKGEIKSVLNDFPMFGMQHLKLSSEGSMGIDEDRGNLEKIFEKLKKDPRIKKVIKNYKIYPLGHTTEPHPNDEQWQKHLVDFNPPISNLWGLEKIGMDKAWKEAGVVWKNSSSVGTTEEVVVAVIDSGIALSHPDLKDKLWVNRFEMDGTGIPDKDDGDPLTYVDDKFGFNFLSLRNPTECQQVNQIGTDLSDGIEHGSPVTGVILADGDNNSETPENATGTVGINGYAGNIQVKVMPLKIFCNRSLGRTWTTTDIAIAAFEYAIAMGVKVINASWSLAPGIDELGGLEEVFQRANLEDILIVVAAGNDKANHDSPNFKVYPASFYKMENVIVVGATEYNDELREDSDFAETASVWNETTVPTILLVAPGEAILSTSPDPLFPIKTYVQTSIAAPFVSGCAAFVQAQRKVKGLEFLKPLELKRLLWESGKTIKWHKEELDKEIDGRRLDCYKAFKNGV